MTFRVLAGGARWRRRGRRLRVRRVGRLRLGRNLLLAVLLFVLVSAASIWLAVRLTPMQSVSAAGQNVQVGAVQPDLSRSGPGELDLFGEAIPTQPHFDGPIRPRLKLAQITFSQVDEAFHGAGSSLVPLLSRELAAGWKRYCVWESLVAAGCAAVLTVAVAGAARCSTRVTFGLLAASLVAVTAANAVGIYLLASSTPRALRQVHTLDDLVGRAPAQPVPAAQGPALPGVHAVVLGDSTAAGIGNRLVHDPTALDRACGRSADAYPAVLAAVNDWKVLNLACRGATVNNGVLGVQVRGDQVAPPQLSVAQRATSASVIILSVGANDMNWAVLTGLCAASPVCDDSASTAYFKEQLADFSQNYLDLLEQLAALPRHPAVLINEYYEPFGNDISCLAEQGMTNAKAEVLRSRLSDLNAVLRSGARTFHFAVARPNFRRHGVCTSQPFVQGPDDDAPLHPTAAGQLAIALADQRALGALSARRSTPTPAPTSAVPSPATSSPATTPTPSGSG